MPRWCHLVLLACALGASACESKKPPTPSPGSGNGETITGRERLGWDQPAADGTELATFRYAVYVDGTRSQLADVACAGTAGTNGFACSGRLPSMSNGAHTLELAAFIESSGSTIESEKSPPLQVTVAAATSPAALTPLTSGDVIVTSDGVRLEATVVAAGLNDPVDLAVLPDARIVVAERRGALRILSSGHDAVEVAMPERVELLSIAPAPDFSRTARLFALQAEEENGGTVLRLARLRISGQQLADRVLLLPDLPTGGRASGVVRVGPDGRLYVSTGDGDDAAAAARLSDWRGKVLRLEMDGRTPDDQPAASPVFWSRLREPLGMGWTRDGAVLWIADHSADGVERLKAIATDGGRVKRAGERASYTLPKPHGTAGLTSYALDAIPEFAGDLFAGARDGGYLLRIRLHEADRSRPVTSERLLEGRIGPVHALAVAPDGSIYFCTATELWRLRGKF